MGNLKTGDTPKLSRLQHKESFSNGHLKTNGTSVGHIANGEKNGGEQTGVTTPRSEDDTRKSENGQNGNIKASEEQEVLKNDDTNKTNEASDNVTSVTVTEKPQVSKVHLGEEEPGSGGGVTLIQKNEETLNTSCSQISSNESTTVSVTQSSVAESKESSEKTVVKISNDSQLSNNVTSEENSVFSSSMTQESSSTVESSSVVEQTCSSSSVQEVLNSV